eukprot:COSAG01_NODE_411_length_17360_cov_11.401852_9_plen_42_part_00
MSRLFWSRNIEGGNGATGGQGLTKQTHFDQTHNLYTQLYGE